MPSQLVVSLSGIGASTLDRCAAFVAELDRRHIPLSLLIAPRTLGPGAELDWIRERSTSGDALVLHGFDHTADPCRRAMSIRRRAEFSALPAHEAGLRLTAARAGLENLGLTTDLFAPPRWLASPGTLTALRRHKFALCADAAAVRDLHTGVVRTGRVHGLGRALGERGEPWWCLALVMGAARAAKRGGLVRVTVDATDLDRLGPRQAVLDAVDIALHHDARPTTYAGLTAIVPTQRQTSVASPWGSGATPVPSGASRSNQP